MGDDFKCWRRKLGVATLVIGCIAMGGWIRSGTIQDTISKELGSTLLFQLTTTNYRLVVTKISIEGDQSLSHLFWISENAERGEWTLTFFFRDGSRSPALINPITSDLCTVGDCSMISNHMACAVVWCQFSYGTIITPMPLISLLLILSNRYESRAMKIVGSAPDKVT